MRTAIVILFILSVSSCRRQSQHTEVAWADAQNISSRHGIVLIEAKPFTGVVYQLYPPGDTEFVRMYKEGKLSGESRGWYENGNPKFVYHYKDDVFEGNVQEWFPNGKMYRSFNYINGQEEGMQTMYWDNGKLRANYQSKNGRKYGLTGIKNCTSPWTDSLRQLLITSGM